ncbi:MAG: reverse transcriptase family protein, partial [Pseudomonadota bacterium]
VDCQNVQPPGPSVGPSGRPSVNWRGLIAACLDRSGVDCHTVGPHVPGVDKVKSRPTGPSVVGPSVKKSVLTPSELLEKSRQLLLKAVQAKKERQNKKHEASDPSVPQVDKRPSSGGSVSENSETGETWFKKVARMSDKEIEKELEKDVLKDVDLTATSLVLDESNLKKLKRWIVKRRQTFTEGSFMPKKPKHNVEMRIETTVDNPNIRQYPYRMNPTDCDTVREQIDEWKAGGVVQDSVSPWSSNVVLVRKADKKARVAIDYRKLNSITKKDAYALPRVDHVFDVMNGMQFVSVTDCHSAFLQIPIRDRKSRELTAFAAPDGGLYEFLRCPFGLVNAPGVWQRLIDSVMVGYKWKFVLTYVDDITVFTKEPNLEAYLDHLDKVFDRLDEHELTVKASKTALAVKKLPFLGACDLNRGNKT